MEIYYFISTVFFTLFFVVDPLGLIPIFATLLSGQESSIKRSIILKATAISIFISLFFIIFGKYLLHFLGISPGTFLVAGGILLFLIAMEMLLGKPSKLNMQDIDTSNERFAKRSDIAVFPLAIPLLCGPGNIAALLMFSSQSWGSILHTALIGAISTFVFLIAMVVMFLASEFEQWIGETGISIIERLTGLILSAMSVQFIVNGLKTMKVLTE
ncbi:MAG: MarC family protein [Spirochaetes bacterium]|nr:MarC family protein [Spirochaetota bacterium]